MDQKITIVDVAPRDGLQAETKMLSPETRAELVKRIAQAGVPRIEIGSFVNPKQVPKMAGMDLLCDQLNVSQKGFARKSLATFAADTIIAPVV